MPLRCHGISAILLAFLGLLTIIGVPPSRTVPQTIAIGALIGEVLDPTGKGIPGASVELKNQEMAATRSTVSDEEGRFVFTLLPPGIYQVTAQRDGYSLAKSAVTVSVKKRTVCFRNCCKSFGMSDPRFSGESIAGRSPRRPGVRIPPSSTTFRTRKH